MSNATKRGTVVLAESIGCGYFGTTAKCLGRRSDVLDFTGALYDYSRHVATKNKGVRICLAELWTKLTMA